MKTRPPAALEIADLIAVVAATAGVVAYVRLASDKGPDLVAFLAMPLTCGYLAARIARKLPGAAWWEGALLGAVGGPFGLVVLILSAARPGPRDLYCAGRGPTDGPIRPHDGPMALEVVTGPGRQRPLGMAVPAGSITDRGGPMATFRLTIGKVELPGRYVCVGQRFVPAGEWEPEQG